MTSGVGRTGERGRRMADDRVRRTLRVPRDLAKAISKRCSKLGVSANEWLISLARSALNGGDTTTAGGDTTCDTTPPEPDTTLGSGVRTEPESDTISRGDTTPDTTPDTTSQPVATTEDRHLSDTSGTVPGTGTESLSCTSSLSTKNRREDETGTRVQQPDVMTSPTVPGMDPGRPTEWGDDAPSSMDAWVALVEELRRDTPPSARREIDMLDSFLARLRWRPLTENQAKMILELRDRQRLKSQPVKAKPLEPWRIWLPGMRRQYATDASSYVSEAQRVLRKYPSAQRDKLEGALADHTRHHRSGSGGPCPCHICGGRVPTAPRAAVSRPESTDGPIAVSKTLGEALRARRAERVSASHVSDTRDRNMAPGGTRVTQQPGEE